MAGENPAKQRRVQYVYAKELRKQQKETERAEVTDALAALGEGAKILKIRLRFPRPGEDVPYEVMVHLDTTKGWKRLLGWGETRHEAMMDALASGWQEELPF